MCFLDVSHFSRFTGLSCNRFKTVDLTDVADEKNTTAESCTSSMQCTEKYLREAGSEDTQKIATFWYNVARYGKIWPLGSNGMDASTLQRRHSRIWSESMHDSWITYGEDFCIKAAEYGQLDALQKLR